MTGIQAENFPYSVKDMLKDITNRVKQMKRKIMICLLAFGLFGFAPARQVITVKGSDTMVILAQRWAESYMTKHPDILVQVTGGGSGTGISSLINGTTDICTASRPMKASEKDKMKIRYKTMGVEIKAAKDGLSIYLNDANPVNELTLKQIKDIFTGKIKNWKDVGGKNARIILYGRENNSGTYVFLKDYVLNGADYTKMVQSLPGTASVVNAVARDKNGIGYGGDAYGKGIKIAAIKKDDKTQGIKPNDQSIKDNSYPITRYLYLFVRNRPSGLLKDYIDWILSREGQSIVKKVGYFPVK
jgi:phosphate transport system substrate-binding protein